MSNCFFCGRPAGFMKKKHKECEQKHQDGWEKMIALTSDAIVAKKSTEELEPQLKSIARTSFHEGSGVRDAMIHGWEQTVNHFLDDGHLDESEEERLQEFASCFSLTQEHLDHHGAWTRLVKGAILRDLMSGNIPERIRLEGNLPFNFQKTEKLIWVFPDTEYYEDRKRRQYVGGSHGVGVRIAKGVYYRVGAFKGHRVDTVETIHVGSGPFGVTNKHIYFASREKSLRIRHDKIVTIEPHADGVTVQRDAQTAKPQMFVTGDGWFTYNLLMNVSNL